MQSFQFVLTNNGIFLYFSMSFILSSVVPCRVEKFLLLRPKQWLFVCARECLLLPDGDFQFHIIFASKIWCECVDARVSHSAAFAVAFVGMDVHWKSWCATLLPLASLLHINDKTQIHCYIFPLRWTILLRPYSYRPFMLWVYVISKAWYRRFSLIGALEWKIISVRIKWALRCRINFAEMRETTKGIVQIFDSLLV